MADHAIRLKKIGGKKERIIIQGTLAGVPCKILFDTGAETDAVRKQFVDQNPKVREFIEPAIHLQQEEPLAPK